MNLEIFYFFSKQIIKFTNQFHKNLSYLKVNKKFINCLMIFMCNLINLAYLMKKKLYSINNVNYL